MGKVQANAYHAQARKGSQDIRNSFDNNRFSTIDSTIKIINPKEALEKKTISMKPSLKLIDEDF